MATLITTIGTGGENKTTGAWEYSQAYYRYNDEGAVRTSYIGKALVDSSLGYKINRIIVFGTASTGWGNLIGGFGLENDPDCSDLWLDLKQVEEDARKDKSVGIDEEKLNTLRSLLNKKLSKISNYILFPLLCRKLKFGSFYRC